MTLYRTILRDAWRFTRSRPWLWFFGLFAALIFPNKEYEVVINQFLNVDSLQGWIDQLRDLFQSGKLAEAWTNFGTTLSTNLLTGILAVIALLLVTFLVFWVVTVSQAALISAAAWQREGKDSDFSASFIDGRRSFVPLLLVNLYAKILIYGLFVVIELPLTIFYMRGGSPGLGIAIVIMGFLILIPLNILVTFITRYASAYVVLEGKRVWEAIRLGWQLFVRHWLVSIEAAMIFFLLDFAVSAIVVNALILFGIAPTTPGINVTYIIIALLTAVITAFQYVAWTFLFLDLQDRKITPKLIRWFAKGSLKSG